MKARRPGELEMIAGIRRAAGRGGAARGIRVGIGDDCAVLRVPRGHELLVTTDLSLEGRHFRRDWHPARAVGHRTLARGLSDLAAMGAKPLAAFLSLALPRELAGSAWLQEFMDGLLALAKASDVRLAGGDTAESGGGVIADIVLTGTAPAGKALLRSGARVGDHIYVTGGLGGSAAELCAARTADGFAWLARSAEENASIAPRSQKRDLGHPDFSQHPHLYPQPRLVVGETLRRRGLATACIDVSDGVSTDLAHLCAESGCGAVIEAASLPVHPLAAGRADALELALHGGEDYELLFTGRKPMPRTIAGVKVTRIGTVVKGRGVKIIVDGKTRKLEAQGWEHFAQRGRRDAR
ncbi:MAG: thiamine-phosphate kinase [Acidobacteriaceae bacterium]|nr:thiamine-phosphate kinase [Acidobacteriaceae bacterium]